MPSQPTPEKRALQTLRFKVEMGYVRNSKGLLGRKLTEQELETCKRKIAELEAQRTEGIERRMKVKKGEAAKPTKKTCKTRRKRKKVAKEDRRELGEQAAQRKQALLELKHEQEDEQRQRKDDKIRKSLTIGLPINEVDRLVHGVLIRGGVLSPQCFEIPDLGAPFELCGLECRLAELDGSMARVQVMRWERRAFPESELKRLGLEKMEAQPPNNYFPSKEIIYREESRGLAYNDPFVKTGAERWILVKERYAYVRLLMPASIVLEQLRATGEPSPKRPEKPKTIRIHGDQGFDIQIKKDGAAYAVGDLYHAGQVLQSLQRQAVLHLYKNRVKLGTHEVVEMVPKMVLDHRGRKAFDVDGKITVVARVTMLVRAPTRLCGCWGYWEEGYRSIVSDFEALLTADPVPYGIKAVMDGKGMAQFEAYDPNRKMLRLEDAEVHLSKVREILCEM
ncbi:unnamed protein product [Symbiodinium sp. CCMP2592]|nr:unnamed protein product [Symbiodinium sp. CCMP2592]